jgi:general secretion pathway protein I
MTIREIPLKGTGSENSMSGFTLVEVLVTFAITAISLVLVLQLFSIGMRTSISSCNYTTAIIHAKDRMEGMYIDPVPGSGTFEDGFEWESDVQPYEGLEDDLEETRLNMLELKVKVKWAESSNKEKSFEMTGLKIVEDEDE